MGSSARWARVVYLSSMVSGWMRVPSLTWSRLFILVTLTSRLRTSSSMVSGILICLLHLKLLIQNVPVAELALLDNVWYWSTNISGIFSSKSAYSWLLRQEFMSVPVYD